MLRLDRVEGGIVIEVVLEVGGQDGLMRGARGVGRRGQWAGRHARRISRDGLGLTDA